MQDHPATKAKELIGQALAAVQDDPAAEGSLGMLASTLAKAQTQLFAASEFVATTPASVAKMRQAMEYLARTLQMLQDLHTDSKASQVAQASVASSLATLYSATEAAEEAVPSKVQVSSKPPAKGAPVAQAKLAPGVAPPPTDDDRRRKTIRLDLESTLDMDSDTHFYTGLSGRIDEGGIFIATFDIKPINSKIAVRFTLPSGEVIVNKGLVRWIREYNPTAPDLVPGMGVRFVNLPEEDRQAIEGYLERRAPLFYDDE